MIHELKTDVEYFQAVYDGDKNFEVRPDDRDLKVGDVLHLREFDPEKQIYTGRDCRAGVTYILREYPGVKPGLCILSTTTEFVECNGRMEMMTDSMDDDGQMVMI